MVLKLDPGNMEAQNEVKKINEVSGIRSDLVMSIISQAFLSLFFIQYFFALWSQALGKETPTFQSEATQPQEASTVDPEQQGLMEEQQGRQEAVLQKDRVRYFAVCPVGHISSH